MAVYGGGIENANGSLTLTDSTVSGNSATGLAGGIANRGAVQVGATIVAGNTGGNCAGGAPVEKGWVGARVQPVSGAHYCHPLTARYRLPRGSGDVPAVCAHPVTRQRGVAARSRQRRLRRPVSR